MVMIVKMVVMDDERMIEMIVLLICNDANFRSSSVFNDKERFRLSLSVIRNCDASVGLSAAGGGGMSCCMAEVGRKRSATSSSPKPWSKRSLGLI